jgi:hypothetical protein
VKIIAFDLDDTLCRRDTEEGGTKKYLACEPIPEMIAVVNQCYDQGHQIIIYTARGMSVFKGNRDDITHHLYDLTKNQLKKWGVRHHKLVMGKLHYDILVDDKVMHIKDIVSADDITGFLQ